MKHYLRYILLLVLGSSLLTLNAQSGEFEESRSNEIERLDKEAPSIYENLKKSKEHSTFVKALDVTGLSELVKLNKGITVFAPNNEAFKSEKELFDQLFKPENKETLARIISAHISQEFLSNEELDFVASDASRKISLNTMMGHKLKIKKEEVAFKIVTEDKQEVVFFRVKAPSNNGVFFNAYHCLLVD